MKIALLISGRATRYEVCLLPILENSKHEIDLFMSINDEDCEYYEEMKNVLQKWLKGLYIKPYIIPESVEFTHNNLNSLQYVNNKWVPFNQMSMFFNDHNAMNMAVNYEKNNNIKYDCFMKFRSDIYISSIPSISQDLILPLKEIKLYSIIPNCNFISNGIYRVPIVSDAWCWGNKESMIIYCNTYNYVLEKLKELNGNYYIAFECSLTDNIYSNNIPIEYIKYEYALDVNRRILDKNFIINSEGIRLDTRNLDARPHFPTAHSEYIDIKTIKNTKHIPVIPCNW